MDSNAPTADKDNPQPVKHGTMESQPAASGETEPSSQGPGDSCHSGDHSVDEVLTSIQQLRELVCQLVSGFEEKIRYDAGREAVIDKLDFFGNWPTKTV